MRNREHLERELLVEVPAHVGVVTEDRRGGRMKRELRHHWVVGRPKRRADYIGDRGRRAEPRKP